jgi:hypothetical protein
MATGKIDKLLRSFLQDTSNASLPYDQFKDLQDPTYLSFRLDFFPDAGFSLPDDAYSSGGLFRKPSDINTQVANSAQNYQLYDTADEYLRRIGSPNRQAYLRIFTNLLSDIQEKAPWYFQSVSGLAELYKIDPAVNFRGKDKILTIECLESIDLRMTLLSDLYRNLAFDMENMREILPQNLRTFSMKIHVMEFRKFNTTFGIIADHYAVRATKGQVNLENEAYAKRRNVFNQGASSLFTGTFDALADIGGRINSAAGGLFTNLGDQPGNDDSAASLGSAFDAITVQTFFLKDCEFDFFSEAPAYLENVSVKEIPEASHKFKIKVGKIQKLSSYNFYNYVIAEYVKNTRIPTGALSNVDSGYLPAGIENLGSNYLEDGISPATAKSPASLLGRGGVTFNLEEGLSPNTGTHKTSLADARIAARLAEDELRRTPLERALGSVINNFTDQLNQGINQGLGQLTGGILGTQPLGNVYGNPAVIQQAANALNNFLTPGNQLPSDNQSNTPPAEILKNIQFEALNINRNLEDTNVFANVTPPPPSPGELGDINVFE